jgi:GNAT superfamily N-acetyltransferase
LTEDDIPSALALSTGAGWNQTADDWRLLLRLASVKSLAVEVEGELASTTTLIRYGRLLGWIGMVLTAPHYQGRGFARSLVTEACRIADSDGIETLKLDATDQGKALYESVGFRVEQPVERWERSLKLSPKPSALTSSSALSASARSLDDRAFGADRSDLLRELAVINAPIASDSAYVLTRPGRLRQYLGPCIAPEPSVARSLVNHALAAQNSGVWYWDLLPENANAASLAREFQFEPIRRLDRMVRGNNRRGEEQSVYALAGFEFG